MIGVRKSYPKRALTRAACDFGAGELGFPWLTPVTISRLLHHIAGPAIAVGPEWTLRTILSVGVIDPLLVRAAYNSIRHDDRLGSMIPHEPEDIASNGRIGPNVALLGEPAFQCSRLRTLRIQNRNRDFARAFVIGTVERDRCDRIATEAPASFLLQR